MLLPAQRLVVLGFLGCLAGLDAAAQDPVVPSQAARDSAGDADTSTCARLDGPGEPVSLIGLTEAVSPAHAPVPANDSERLLFRQVYDTLVHLDCHFAVHPGLAASWQRDAAGTGWLMTLRRDARFSDGTAVNARDVVASWTRDAGALRPEVARFVRTATALDEATLSIVLQPQADLETDSTGGPRALAQPALAVARVTTESPWPLGSRDVRLEPPAAAVSGRTTIILAPALLAGAPPSPATSPPPPAGPVRFLVSPNGDARDLLDQDVDLILTRDPAVLAYASVLARFDSIPLPWLRSYIFLSRGRTSDASLAPELRQALANDAVPGEAQGSSFDWNEAWRRCASSDPLSPRSTQLSAPEAGVSRFVYERSDPVARSLVERIAALASARSTGGDRLLDVLLPDDRSRKPQIVPLRETDLSAALIRGDHAGFVLALDRTTGCAEIATLQERAPWVTEHAVVPLVDTRLRALVRKGRSQMTLEWDGSLLVGGQGRSQ
jgi:hypothetical protein